MTRTELLATRNAAEAALERGGLTVDERIALMNVSLRAQRQLDAIAQSERMANPIPLVSPLNDALARFFSPYEQA